MVSIEKTLKNVFDKPLRKLTEHQRKFVFHHIKDWAIMSSEQRRAKATEADRQFQNKERLKSTRYIKPLTEEELEQYTAGWDDATLEANHWFSQSMVSPTNAAMLLCQHNPNEISFDDAVLLLTKHKGHGITIDPKETDSEYRSSPITGPQQLVQLKQRFNALSTAEPALRSLQDWLEYARSQHIEYNSWIEKYAVATSAPASEAEPAETVEQRRSRYLAWHGEEEQINPRGAVQRVYKRELKQNPKADRSAIGKDIAKARGTAKTKKTATNWNSQLVTDGKRQG